MIKALGRYAVVAGSGSLIALTVLLPDRTLLMNTQAVFMASLFVFCLSLPLLSMIALGSVIVFLLILAKAANEEKQSLTFFPITLNDLKIAVSNPIGLFDTLAVPYSVGFLIAGSIAAVVLFALTLLASQLVRLSPRARVYQIYFPLLLLIIANVSLFNRLREIIIDQRVDNIEWSSSKIGSLAGIVGPVPLLTLMSLFPDKGLFDRVSHDIGSAFVPEATLDRLTPMLQPRSSDQLRPNVVFVLLESTFDVDKMFRVSPEVRSQLRSDYEGAALSGPFDVNAIGGGTWITEFEVLTGLDWRWFGISGYTTHVTIAPKMRGSFATYLRKLGYSTVAYYPVGGAFYGARKAYQHYGFEKFLDGHELGFRGKRWAEINDSDFLQTVATDLSKSDTSNPFFAFVLTIGNHAPHPCLIDTPRKHRFLDEVDDGQNCELNEYIRRYEDTEKGIRSIEAFLLQKEKMTDRPYVLVLFGDHIPHTFVGSRGYSHYDYGRLLQLPKSQTFYQVRTSIETTVPHKVKQIKSSLLETLVSNLIRREAEPLYLPENLMLETVCGDELQTALNSAFVKNDGVSGFFSENCQQLVNSLTSRAKRDLF